MNGLLKFDYDVTEVTLQRTYTGKKIKRKVFVFYNLQKQCCFISISTENRTTDSVLKADTQEVEMRDKMRIMLNKKIGIRMLNHSDAD